VEQTTIVARATWVFHKRSLAGFANAARLDWKDLARWQRDAVDIALKDSYQTYTERMERAKYSLEHQAQSESIATMEEHEMDLMPGEDDEPRGVELAEDEDITWIESYEGLVVVLEISIEEKLLPPESEENPDGHRSPERLEAFRAEDHVPGPPRSIQTMPQVLRQATPRPKSREIPIEWGIEAPEKAGGRI
jgi:hypothetical protein